MMIRSLRNKSVADNSTGYWRRRGEKAESRKQKAESRAVQKNKEQRTKNTMINVDTQQQMPKKEEEQEVDTWEPSDSITDSNNDDSGERQPHVKQENEQENNAVALEEKQENTNSGDPDTSSMNNKVDNNNLEHKVNNNAVVLKQEQEEQQSPNESHESHDGVLNGNATNEHLQTKDEDEGVVLKQDEDNLDNGCDDGSGGASEMHVDDANDNEETRGDIAVPKEEEKKEDGSDDDSGMNDHDAEGHIGSQVDDHAGAPKKEEESKENISGGDENVTIISKMKSELFESDDSDDIEEEDQIHSNTVDINANDDSSTVSDNNNRTNDNNDASQNRQDSCMTYGDIALPKDREDSDDDDVDRDLFSDDDNDDDHDDDHHHNNDENDAVVNRQDSMQTDLEEEETNKKVSQRPVKVTNYNDCTNCEDCGEGFPYHKYYKSELNELISRREWDKALERLRQNKTVMLKEKLGCASFDSSTDEEEEEEKYEIQEVGFVNELGALPLHQALYTEEEAPPDIFIEELIKKGMAFQSVEKRHLMSRLLPLQIACSPGGVDRWKRSACDGSPEDKIIRHLIKACPESLVATDNTLSEDCGGPPLQLLMVHNPGVQLFDFIMETLEENDNVQQALSRPDPDGDLPLHAAVKNCVSHDIILKIIDSNKKAAETETNAGMYPLHYAALWGCHEKVLDELLDSHFTALQKRTKKDYGWDTPIHLAFHSKDNIERWMWTENDDNGEDNNNSVMRPGLMVDAMLREFHARLKETYEQGLGEKKTMKRKRTTQPQAQPRAFTVTQTLCKGKKFRNNSNKTVLEQVRKCKEEILSQPNGRTTQDFQNICLMIQEIVDGKNVFQR